MDREAEEVEPTSAEGSEAVSFEALAADAAKGQEAFDFGREEGSQ